ncbi:MAG: flavodoxin family protein [Gemmatimonadota bacterium]
MRERKAGHIEARRGRFGLQEDGRGWGGRVWGLALAALLAAGANAAAQQERASSTVLVAYYSRTGSTEAMARAAADGAAEVEGVVVRLERMEDVTPEDVEGAGGIILAAPTHWANLPAEATALLNRLPFLDGKPAGVVSTGGNPGGGNEHVLFSLMGGILNHGGMILGPVYERPDGSRFGTLGASAVTGPADPGVSDFERDMARRLGRRVGRAAGGAGCPRPH